MYVLFHMEHNTFSGCFWICLYSPMWYNALSTPYIFQLLCTLSTIPVTITPHHAPLPLLHKHPFPQHNPLPLLPHLPLCQGTWRGHTCDTAEPPAAATWSPQTVQRNGEMSEYIHDTSLSVQWEEIVVIYRNANYSQWIQKHWIRRCCDLTKCFPMRLTAQGGSHSMASKDSSLPPHKIKWT